jgi:hypothetical protein
MSDDTKKTMTKEEAIMEIRSPQLKHNQEIKDMQEKSLSIVKKQAG